MPHIDRHIGPHERLIYRGRYHWWHNLRSFGLLNMINEVGVTDSRILKKTGILNVEVQSLSFENLEARDLSHSIWGRIFGWGDVVLYGIGGQSERFEGLADPVRFLRAIDVAQHNRTASRAPAPSASHSPENRSSKALP